MSAGAFSQKLLQVLGQHPAGISEYELIKCLEADGHEDFDSKSLREPLTLFQTHFLLFHILYLLRDELFADGRYRLDINPLCIQLQPLEASNAQALDTHDPLREYYLDLDNLKNTDAREVDALLGRFWMRFVSNDERRNALAQLELDDPVDWRTIKTRHRQLVTQHHPDRGGDKERLQAINAAVEVLGRSRSQKN